MNERHKKTLIGIIFLIGSGLSGAAVFAYPLGLALDAKWGRGQTLLLAVGLVFIGCAAGMLFQPILQAAAQRLRRSPLRHRLAAGLVSWMDALQRSAPGRLAKQWILYPMSRVIEKVLDSSIVRAVRQRPALQIAVLTLLAGLLVEMLYLWFVSVGFWIDWPGTTDYYDRLAVAFRHGQVSLEERPDPALLSLADPYDPAQRGTVPVLWDMTLFKGKYYLYWGPVPAIIVAVVRQVVSHQVGDAELVLGFVSGSFVLSVLILLHLRGRHFSHLPVWSFFLAVLVAGLANPMPWLLSRPAVYEAAIAAGQFFLLGGIYALLSALDRPQPFPWQLACAGTLWAGAIGSRTSLGLGIGFMVGAATLRLLLWAKQTGRYRQAFMCLACLGLPLAVGATGLGWYNWARFGSVLDFGHRYQITGMNLNKIYAHVFAIANVLPNLHNYLLNPFSRLEIFPFIKPQWGLHGMLLRLPVPQPYYFEQITGLLPATPFLLLALFPLAWLGMVWRHNKLPAGTPADKPGMVVPAEQVWSVIYLAGGTALIFAADLGYVVNTMRYLADVVPCLVLLASLGLWQGYTALENRLTWRRIYSLAGACLAVYSVVVGLLLAVTGYLARFEHLNPDLFETLTRWFAR